MLCKIKWKKGGSRFLRDMWNGSFGKGILAFWGTNDGWMETLR